VQSSQQDGDGLEFALERSGLRIVAFHLPQFHPIAQNDGWWGDGFTEWTLVRRARPLFRGHNQPRVPSPEIGYYDLTAPGVSEMQVRLARAHGIHAFAFYHFWFNGTRLLERPVEEWLRAGPAFPFCLAWANEPWTREWDGRDDCVLQAQDYGDRAVWRRHFAALRAALVDPRALRVDGRPVILLYRAGHIPHLEAMLATWREEAHALGDDLFVVAMLSGFEDRSANYAVVDATCEFAPFAARSFRAERPQRREGFIDDYDAAWSAMFEIPDLHPVQFRGCFVSFDNTPRRGRRGVIYEGATPEKYRHYLAAQIRRTMHAPRGYRVIFVNAWNEWSEGCYLEPDARLGRAYLEATRAAILDALADVTPS
jgi:lipopolysaccharide biosynthesis protein